MGSLRSGPERVGAAVRALQGQALALAVADDPHGCQAASEGLEVEHRQRDRRRPDVAVVGAEQEPVEAALAVLLAGHDRPALGPDARCLLRSGRCDRGEQHDEDGGELAGMIHQHGDPGVRTIVVSVFTAGSVPQQLSSRLMRGTRWAVPACIVAASSVLAGLPVGAEPQAPHPPPAPRRGSACARRSGSASSRIVRGSSSARSWPSRRPSGPASDLNFKGFYPRIAASAPARGWRRCCASGSRTSRARASACTRRPPTRCAGTSSTTSRLGRLPHRGPPSCRRRSTKGDDVYELGGLPRAGRDRLVLYASLRYRHYPRDPFFGLGQDARLEDRTTFLHQDATLRAGGRLAVQRARLVATVRAGLLQAFRRTGQDDDLPTIRQRFDDESAPGLARQPDFLQARRAWSCSTGATGRATRTAAACWRLGVARFDDRERRRLRLRPPGARRARLRVPGLAPARAGRARASLARPGRRRRARALLPAGGARRTATPCAAIETFRFRGEKLLLAAGRVPLGGGARAGAGAVRATAAACSGATRTGRSTACAASYGFGLRLKTHERRARALRRRPGATRATRVVPPLRPVLLMRVRCRASSWLRAARGGAGRAAPSGSCPTTRCAATATTCPSRQPRRGRAVARPTTSSSTRSTTGRTAAARAGANVNTLGEVPDSSWFENRIGVRDHVDRGARARARPAATGPTRPALDGDRAASRRASRPASPCATRGRRLLREVRPPRVPGPLHRRRGHRRRASSTPSATSCPRTHVAYFRREELADRAGARRVAVQGRAEADDDARRTSTASCAT